MSVQADLPTTDPPSQQSGGANLARRVARGGVLLIAARTLTQVALWPVIFIVARLLNPSDYGLMTSGMIFVGLTDTLSDAGMARALVQKKDMQPRDVSEAFTITVGLAALCYAVLFLSADLIASFLHSPEFAPFLRVLALTTVLIPFRAIPLALLEREHMLGSQSVVHVTSALIQPAVLLGMALAGMSYWSLVIGVLVARVTEAVLLAWFARWRPRLAVPGERARSLLGFAVHVTISNLLWYVYSNADVAVVRKMLGQTILGYYSMAFQLMSLPVQKLTTNVNAVIYPVYCRLQNDRPRLRDGYLRLTVLLGVLGIPILTGMALVANDAFSLLLGDKWKEAILPFQTLCFVGSIMVISVSLPPLLNALGRPDLNTKFFLVNTLVLPAGFIVGGWWDGLIGICAAWLVLYPLLTAGFVHLTRHTTNVSLGALCKAQLPVVAAVLFMSLVVLGVQYAVGEGASSLLRLTVSSLTGIVAYAGFLFVFARQTVVSTLFSLWLELRGRESAAA